MPLIERQQLHHAVALREDDDRRAGKADPEIGMLLDHATRESDVMNRDARRLGQEGASGWQ